MHLCQSVHSAASRLYLQRSHSFSEDKKLDVLWIMIFSDCNREKVCNHFLFRKNYFYKNSSMAFQRQYFSTGYLPCVWSPPTPLYCNRDIQSTIHHVTMSNSFCVLSIDYQWIKLVHECDVQLFFSKFQTLRICRNKYV